MQAPIGGAWENIAKYAAKARKKQCKPLWVVWEKHTEYTANPCG